MGGEIWRLGEALSEGDSEFARSVAELLRSTARHTIYATGLLYLTFHLVATVTWPEMLGWKVWAIVPLFVTTIVLGTVYLIFMRPALLIVIPCQPPLGSFYEPRSPLSPYFLSPA